MSAGAPGPAERLAWLRLARTPQIGPVGFARLVARHESALDALDALPDLARRGGGRPPRPCTPEEAEQEMEAIERAGARLLLSCDPDFPPLLAGLDPPPPVLIAKGPLDPAAAPACAIVGSRTASAAGLRFTRQIATELGAAGAVIVSGLARGVDGAAHQGALETGTIAVVAGGIDHVYPPEHRPLHEQIAERGLLVSERRMGQIPTAKDFPRRNRLISGLSLGVLVVEAAVKSGSLITARLAGEQGREVMAVPGSPLDPRSAGTNRLIRDGAALIETAEDVLAVLDGLRPSALRETAYEDYDPEDEDMAAQAPEAARERLIALLSPTPVPLDELARQAGLEAGAARALLLELELAGRALRLAGGLVQGLAAETVS
jgi:DNA processing protein